MQTYLNFNALITETKGKLTTPSVANRVDAFVIAIFRLEPTYNNRYIYLIRF